jgi:hypothetical protein
MVPRSASKEFFKNAIAFIHESNLPDILSAIDPFLSDTSRSLMTLIRSFR